MMISDLLRLTFVALLFVVVAGYSQAEDSFLRISSENAEISLETRDARLAAIRLPALQYTLRVVARCESGQSPRSMLLSIADTQENLPGIDLLDDAIAEITMTIPASQIAPLLLAGFCVNPEDDGQANMDSVTVHGALSAQAALLCSDDESMRIIYASQALGLTLRCLVDSPLEEIEEDGEKTLHGHGKVASE